MTNFEKWKQSLTPENFIGEWGQADGTVKNECILVCDECPVEQSCELNHDCDNCAQEFLKWANGSAEE